MLVEALKAQFTRYFTKAQSHDTVLWFDREQEYTPLLDHLTAAGVSLWRYDGSLLEVRHRLIQRSPGERTVVYLPLHPDQAEVLRPFFATSLLFRESLYRFLRRQGLNFPDDPQVAHELRTLLPRLAARSVGKGRAFWEYNLANLERARETLLEDLDGALLRFLAQPKEELATLKEEQLDGLFFAQLESAYGFSATADDDPAEIAHQLTATLILTCAYKQAGINLREHGLPPGPDFPFPDRLAEPVYRDRCWSLMTRWQYSQLYGSIYSRLAKELESHYDLTRWVLDLPKELGLTLRATFPNVGDALWGHVKKSLASLESEDEWRLWLSAHDGPIGARAGGFWARQGSDPGWGLLVLARDLLVAIDGLRRKLDHWSRPIDALRDYADGWHCIDGDYRRLREALDASAGSHEALRKRCALSYRDALRRMNDRFCTLLDADPVWPPRDIPLQEEFWSALSDPLEASQRVAVFYVDALRYELAQELWERLKDEDAGEKQTLAPRLAAIPTTTPIGMAALLPGGERMQAGYSTDWEITIGGSKNLKDKSARQAWLRQRLPDVHFLNLDKLLNTPSSEIPETAVTIIFDTTLDAVGETAATLAWNTFSTLLLSVKKGVHKLLELGVEQVHVVADHGFLLLDEVGEHEKVSVKDVPALVKKDRYLVGPHLGPTEQLRFPVPHGEDLWAWFPRGVGCFKTPGPYNYVHGGLSLQELVIPHLVIEQAVMGRPVGVQVEFPGVINMAQFKVKLQPVAADIFARPRQVTVSLEKGDQPVVPPLGCVVTPVGPVEVDVFLPMGCGLEPGDQVRWLLRDAVTGEVLASQDAVSQVDLW